MDEADMILAPVIAAFREAVKQLVDASLVLRERDLEMAIQLRELADKIDPPMEPEGE